jgi:hypothetical protein
MKSIKRTYCCFFVICVTLSLLTSCDKISKSAEKVNQSIQSKEVVKPTQPEIINNNDFKRWVFLRCCDLYIDDGFENYLKSQYGEINDCEDCFIHNLHYASNLTDYKRRIKYTIKDHQDDNCNCNNYNYNNARIEQIYNAWENWNKNILPSLVIPIKYDQLESDDNIYEKYIIIYRIHYNHPGGEEGTEYARAIVSVFNDDGHWEGNIEESGETINEVDYNINNNNN